MNSSLLLLVITALGPLTVQPLLAEKFTVLHNFTPVTNSTNSDGANPFAGLTLLGNTLYGTAPNGGSGTGGTIFQINTDGTGFGVLHSFSGYGNSDGLMPTGGLVLSSNTLYGTTVDGGLSYPVVYGTIYAINTDATGFQILYPFPFSSTGGMQPQAGLINSSNALYGTTGGTVFTINTDGTGFSNLYNFTGNDGTSPYSKLTLSGNTLYGTAAYGGISGNGTAFAIDTDSTGYRTLHPFTATPSPASTNSDGANPFSRLVSSGNTLFGTALYGGSYGAGTLFSINTDGTGFTVLHHFSGSDGAAPTGVVLRGGTLYGTTAGGGSSQNGTLFSVNTNGSGFTTLFNFTDAMQPFGELILVGTTFYGTTENGGSGGSGTVFSFSILPQLTITPSARNIVLTWSTNSTGFTLQSTSTIGASAIWTTNLPAPVVANGQYTVTNPISSAQQFFRLSQ